MRALAVALATTVLAGCVGLGSPGATETPPPLHEQLAELPGVVAVEGGDLELVVEVGTPALDELLATAEAARELALERGWPGRVALAHDPSGPGAWRVEVHPATLDAVEADVRGVLAIVEHPDVLHVGIIAGWPYLTLTSLETFAASVRELSGIPRLAEGATYSYAGERPRLHVVHLPERMTLEAVDAVVRIAVENPESEVELQSLTTPGNRWPELWVAGLSEEQRARVEAQLRDPALADADPEGYSIPFQLAVLGPDGPVLTHGTLGDVPDTSAR